MYWSHRRRRNFYLLSILVLLILAWSLLLYLTGPAELVEAIGVRNGYILGFLVAAIGGVSTVTSISFYSVVTALAAGGLNPFLLGLVMGTGVTIGDSLFFYLGRTGRRTLPDKIQYHVDQALEWAYDQRRGTIHVLIFAWAAFMPLPNDLITIPSGMSKLRAVEILPFILAGNITFTTLLALVMQSGIMS